MGSAALSLVPRLADARGALLTASLVPLLAEAKGAFASLATLPASLVALLAEGRGCDRLPCDCLTDGRATPASPEGTPAFLPKGRLGTLLLTALLGLAEGRGAMAGSPSSLLVILRADGRGLDPALPMSLALALGCLGAAKGSDAEMDSAAEEDRDRLVRRTPLLLRRPVTSGSCAVDGLQCGNVHHTLVSETVQCTLPVEQCHGLMLVDTSVLYNRTALYIRQLKTAVSQHYETGDASNCAVPSVLSTLYCSKRTVTSLCL